MNSIARATNLLGLYSLAVYLGVGAMALYLSMRKKKLEKDKTEQIERSLTFMFIVIVAIAVNSLTVGLTIFTQPRYMLYTMGLFYTAACMMLYDVLS